MWKEEDAMDYVAGCACITMLVNVLFNWNNNGTWDKAKAAIRFNRQGPWLVTKDEVTDR